MGAMTTGESVLVVVCRKKSQIPIKGAVNRKINVITVITLRNPIDSYLTTLTSFSIFFLFN